MYAYSLTADLSLMATARGDLVAQRAASARAAKSADGQRDRVEVELSKLVNVRPAATIRAEINGLLADPRVGDCQTMDGPRSTAACPRVASLRAELGNAERKEQLEATLAGIQTATPATTDKPADPAAHALSVYLAALGLVLPERLLTDWLTLIPVLALEIGAALSLLLVQAVSGGKTGHETPRQIEQKSDSHDQARPAQPQNTSPDTKSGSVPPSRCPLCQRQRRQSGHCKKPESGHAKTVATEAADSPANADSATSLTC